MEALASHAMPISPKTSMLSGAPELDLSESTPNQVSVAAGNAMNIPCVGAVLLATLLCFKKEAN